MTHPIHPSAILIEDFDYPLPDDRIAKYPLQERDMSKLLIWKNKKIAEDIFLNSPQYLPENSLLVYNNTRVIQARMLFQKKTGARIEIFCLEPAHPSDYALSFSANERCAWKCMVGNKKKWRSGTLDRTITLGNQNAILCANIIETTDDLCVIQFEWNNTNITFGEILDAAGELPIPPYLNRETEESDKKTYQTVYATTDGSVAAPTAGLHFTERVLSQLHLKNIVTRELTLHVGAGTFQPVKSEDANEHKMHAEVISVHRSTMEKLLTYEGKIVAVGTTSVRTLESLYYIGVRLMNGQTHEALHIDQWEPYRQEYTVSLFDSISAILAYLDRCGQNTIHAQTSIMIRPGFQFRVTNAMFTNFHQPKSTLMLLIAAFIGDHWKTVYQFALDNEFRFLSYGDSSLLFHEI